MSVLTDLQAAIADTADRVGPAVVGIGRGWHQGTGVVVAPGRVVTNAHNLRGDEATVTFADGRRVTASVGGADPDGDVAVLALDTGEAPAVDWAPEASGEPVVGLPVLALGNPGGRGLRTTLGFITSTGRTFRGPRGRRIAALEHSAPLPRGSSGGPLVDEAGRLIGLNAIRMPGGFIYAIPADAALRDRVEALGRGEPATTPRLGVALAPAHVARRMRRAVGLPERDGLLVRAIEDGSAAQRAGLERGDLIVAAGGSETTRLEDLYTALDALGPADALELTLVRGEEERTVSVRFDREPGRAEM